MKPLGKLIVFSAPSGSGKTTIVRELLKDPELNLSFSISATSRASRGQEQNGVDYLFLTPEDFKHRAEQGAFLEWEEVYPDHFYGTDKAHVQHLREQGINVLFDVDVKGGIAIKNVYPEDTLAIFVMPPSIEELKRRLESRGTESLEKIEMRMAKAVQEMTLAQFFDQCLVNNELTQAVGQAKALILNHTE